MRASVAVLVAACGSSPGAPPRIANDAPPSILPATYGRICTAGARTFRAQRLISGIGATAAHSEVRCTTRDVRALDRGATCTLVCVDVDGDELPYWPPGHLVATPEGLRYQPADDDVLPMTELLAPTPRAYAREHGGDWRTIAERVEQVAGAWCFTREVRDDVSYTWTLCLREGALVGGYSMFELSRRTIEVSFGDDSFEGVTWRTR